MNAQVHARECAGTAIDVCERRRVNPVGRVPGRGGASCVMPISCFSDPVETGFSPQMIAAIGGGVLGVLLLLYILYKLLF